MTEPVFDTLGDDADDILARRADALAHTTYAEGGDGEQFDREERAALQRIQGLSTELQDVTEVEYRQLRLERVVLAGVWTEGSAEDAENSLRELAALAETAGSTVLAGLMQRRQRPDPGTWLGSGSAGSGSAPSSNGDAALSLAFLRSVPPSTVTKLGQKPLTQE